MSETDEYPRVLVIDSMPFSRFTNNGILKSNLFSGWPKDKLAQIDYSDSEPEFDICNRYWVLTKTDIIKSLLGKAPFSELAIPAEASAIRGDSEIGFIHKQKPEIEKQLSVLPVQIRVIIGELIFRLPSVLSVPLKKWIDAFQPDIIFSVTASSLMLRTVVLVSRWKNIPIIPYFTDDWVTTLYKDHLLKLWLRKSMNYWFKECLRRSPICLANCDAMNEEYSKRYHNKFETFMNLIEIGDNLKANEKISSAGPMRMMFLGNLLPNRWRSLRSIGEKLLELKAEGIHAELLIYTFPDQVKKFQNILTLEPVMRIVGTAAYDEISTLQHEADVLVHAESFKPEDREYTKFSLSTKIPQYMLSGTCIFAYGPGEIASLKYLKDSGTGIVVGEEDPELLRNVLRELIGNKGLRLSTVSRARFLAIERNEGNKNRIRFRQLLKKSCAAWKNEKNIL